MMTAEQLMNTQRTNLEALLGLTSKAFEGVEKLVELNLQTARTAFAELSETTRAALSVKDAQELLALQAGLLQPSAEKAAAYNRHVYEIAAATSAELGKVAEATTADAQTRFMAAVDNAMKNAPAGSENVVALVKSTVSAAGNAFEGVQKAARQAADVAEANLQTLSVSATQATQAATRSKRAA